MNNHLTTDLKELMSNHRNELDESDVNNVNHYIQVDELEIALESLILSFVDKQISLDTDEVKLCNDYLTLYNLKENSVYVDDVTRLFSEFYLDGNL